MTVGASLAADIAAANAGRRPDALARKYALMRGSPLAFLRGTAPLFARDWSSYAPAELKASAVTWLCGDAHIENFGTYRAARGLVVFDLNDFDEAMLGPALYDLARLCASWVVWQGGDSPRVDPTTGIKAIAASYAAALQLGKALWVDRDTATGEIARLMKIVFDRPYAALLEKRTTASGKKRMLALGKRALVADIDERRRATEAIAAFAKGTGDPPERFRVLDVAWRIAGIGSLGLERYAVLVAGDGTLDGMRLLDVKFAAPAALAGRAGAPQPKFASDAARVVTGYQRMQCWTPRRLAAVDVEGRSYVVRTLQPSEDRLDWSDPDSLDVPDLQRTLGELLAWAHLRSSGRDGSATADALVAFGSDGGWLAPFIEYTSAASQRCVADWQAWRATLDH